MTEVIVILVLIVANGLFSGAEIAVVALRKTRIEELAEEGRGSAKAVLALRENPERFLATVQVGITVVGATAAAVGGASIAEEHLVPLLAEVPWIHGHEEGVALTVVIAAISYLSIVVGELVPKSLALRAAERFALLSARPLLLLSAIARPLVWFLSASANVLLKPFGDRTAFTETRHSADEIQSLVEEARLAGTLDPAVGEIASRALDMPALTALDVMVPRGHVVMVPSDASAEELRALVLEHLYSRMPVYERSVDKVVGYILAKDVLAQVLQHGSLEIESISRRPYFVPESKPAAELLKEMRAERRTLAIVVDEHGGTSGIVTLEDLLEELVGDILSEHVVDDRPSIVLDVEDSALVLGTTPVREINRTLGMDLPEDSRWTTIAGLYLALAEGMPRVGGVLELEDGVVLQVVEASPRHIDKLRIQPPKRPETDE